MENLYVDHKTMLQLAEEAVRDTQRKAWEFLKDHIDRGLPCYGWELSPIPSYHSIYGYEIDDDAPDNPGAYLYKTLSPDRA
jgi:hypothetical protein